MQKIHYRPHRSGPPLCGLGSWGVPKRCASTSDTRSVTCQRCLAAIERERAAGTVVVEDIYLCCEHSVPEHAIYTMDEAADLLRWRSGWSDAEADDEEALGRKIRKILAGVSVGWSTDEIPGLTVWRVQRTTRIGG